LINAKRGAAARLDSADCFSRDVIPYSAEHESLIESLAAQAAIALEHSLLYTSIEQLFEGFVRASIVALSRAIRRLPATPFVWRTSRSRWRGRRSSRPGAVWDHPVLPGGDEDDSVRLTPARLRKVGVHEEVLVKAKKLYPNSSM